MLSEVRLAQPGFAQKRFEDLHHPVGSQVVGSLPGNPNARAAPCCKLGRTFGVAVEGDGYGGVLQPFIGCLEVGVPRGPEAVHFWKAYVVG